MISERSNENTKQVHSLINNLLDYSFTQQNGFVKKLNEIELESLCTNAFLCLTNNEGKNIFGNLSGIENVR